MKRKNMLKPTSNYKMSPLLKISLATGKFADAHQRGAWKRACIDAELASKIVVKAPQRDKNAPRGQSNYQTNDTGTASTAK
jgi:hypothetical protein